MIGSDHKIKITNYKSNREYIDSDYLTFGDDGHLYVFFEPETRIAHLNIQY